MNADDDLLRALKEHAPRRPGDATARQPSASLEEIANAEVVLGFELPPLLRRVYEIANGGIGPSVDGLFPIVRADETLASIYRSFADAKHPLEPSELGFAQYPWPTRLVPICDWGCAIWSCLDCRVEAGPIITASNGEPFANTGHTLRSWLQAWLDGSDLFEEMFEPAPARTGINPFTKQPIVIKGQGKPRGIPWP